jgi:hypothetical protein
MTAPESRRSPRQRSVALFEHEYHQARVLLLINAMSGRTGSLDGLTKLAKLDFLLRYPTFLERLLPGRMIGDAAPTSEERDTVESRMIRYKYGPWDDRYYGIIGALVSRGLIDYAQSRGRVALRPTAAGRELSQSLARDHHWAMTADRCALLHEQYGRLTGNALKNLIYQSLPEVVDRPQRAEI